jgi:hypothetical protein
MFMRCFYLLALVLALAFAGAAHAGTGEVFLPVPSEAVYLPVPTADELPPPPPGPVCANGSCSLQAPSFQVPVGFSAPAVSYPTTTAAGYSCNCPGCPCANAQAVSYAPTVTYSQAAPVAYAAFERPRGPFARLADSVRANRELRATGGGRGCAACR